MCSSPVEKLGKGSSFHHRHRWPVFQCGEDLEPGQAQPLLLLQLLHLKSTLVMLPSHRWWPLLLSFHHYVGPLLLKDERGRGWPRWGVWPRGSVRLRLRWFLPQGAPSSLPLLAPHHNSNPPLTSPPPPRNPRVVAALAAIAGSAASVDQSERSIQSASTNQMAEG